jgi:hypothetical protein
MQWLSGRLTSISVVNDQVRLTAVPSIGADEADVVDGVLGQHASGTMAAADFVVVLVSSPCTSRRTARSEAAARAYGEAADRQLRVRLACTLIG